MVSSERIQVTLTGGAPWGFRLAGGGALPLTINKIRKKSRANTQGLVEGDAVISINGIAVHDKSQDEALELVENSGESLALEIFRGDVDELSTDKPKKTIMFGGGDPVPDVLTMTTSVDESFSSGTVVQTQDTSSEVLTMTTSIDEGAFVQTQDTSSELTLTTSVDDAFNTFEQPAEEVSFGLQMTSSVDDVASNSVEQPAEEVSFGLQMTATVDDTSGSAFNANEVTSVNTNDVTSDGLIMNASVDDVSTFSNNVMISDDVPVVSSQVEGSTSHVQEVIQSSSSSTMVMAEPFSENINVSAPNRLSPFAPTPSPKPKSSSPRVFEPLSPILCSPLPFKPIPHIKSNTSTVTFDDGQARKEVTREQHVASSEDGRSTTVVQREISTTTSTKRGPSFVKGQASAFNTVQPTESSQISQQRSTTTSTMQSSVGYNSNFNQNMPTMQTNIAYNSNFNQNAPNMQPNVAYNSNLNQNSQNNHSSVAYNSNLNQNAPTMQSNVAYNSNFNQNTPAPMSSSMSTNYLQQRPPTTFSNSFSSDNIARRTVEPMFKPTKFVPGQSSKVIPGLYTKSSPMLESDAMHNGKENYAPMFQVKKIISDSPRSRKDLWKPNMWLPGQQQPTQTPVAPRQEEFDTYGQYPVPNVQHGISLVQQQQQRIQQQQNQQFQPNRPDYDEDYEEEVDDEQYQSHQRSGRVHVFAPPVEIHARPDGEYEQYSPDGEAYPYEYYYEDGEPISPDSSLTRKKKNLYNDSAFYDTPGKHYPTIGEQMKLCKIIATSLTSQANKQARGAKMFMRRRKRSNKWIHETSEWTSSTGDVANIRDLESELSHNDGGNKPLFFFKIPNLKNRVGNEGKQTKMALSQEEYEKLRLSAKKCDHRNIAPDACFDIVSDLKASKGRGGRLFERRKQRSDKFIVDDDSVCGGSPHGNLNHVLSQPVHQEKSPWDAAMQSGNVNAAFNHISENERNQKLNRMIQFSPPRKPAPSPMPPNVQSNVPLPSVRTSLRSDNQSHLKNDKNYNRAAKGWSGGGEYPVAESYAHISPTRTMRSNKAHVQQTQQYQQYQQPPQSPPQKTYLGSQPQQSPQYGNFNNTVKAWQNPGQSPYTNGQGPALEKLQYSYRKEPEWQAHQPESHAWNGNQLSSQQQYEQPRPQSYYQPDYGTAYGHEYDNNYGSGAYTPTSPAYMQPIIPGTDL